MSLTLEREMPPLFEDSTGAIRVGNSRVLLELVIRAFQDGASPESIVQRYSTLYGISRVSEIQKCTFFSTIALNTVPQTKLMSS